MDERPEVVDVMCQHCGKAGGSTEWTKDKLFKLTLCTVCWKRMP